MDLSCIGPNLSNKFKYTLSDDERRIVCDSVFVTINWFIELINAFSPGLVSADEHDTTAKLVSRLSTVYELKQVLAALLPHTKFYRAPLAVFGLIDSSVQEVPFANSLVKVIETHAKLRPKKHQFCRQKKYFYGLFFVLRTAE